MQKVTGFLAKHTLVVAAVGAIFTLGALSTVAIVAIIAKARAPLHTLAGDFYLPTGDYEVAASVVVGSTTRFLLMDENICFFTKSLPTETIRLAVADGKTLEVRMFNGNKTFTVTNHNKTVIGTNGSSYITQLNTMLAEPKTQEVAMTNEDIPLPPPPKLLR